MSKLVKHTDCTCDDELPWHVRRGFIPIKPAHECAKCDEKGHLLEDG